MASATRRTAIGLTCRSANTEIGRHRGSKAYAAICLADAIRHGDYPDGWVMLDGTKAGDPA